MSNKNTNSNTSHMTPVTGSATDDLKAQISKLREDLDNLGSATKDVAHEKYVETKRAAADAYDR
ncbi:MAG: hypothetical protein KDN05_25960, partial [Verrucomicrobiae bacterium]|nr:hypothetical protein [Verrucomicrobiae bacterium]